jgi:predicted secreted protein
MNPGSQTIHALLLLVLLAAAGEASAAQPAATRWAATSVEHKAIAGLWTRSAETVTWAAKDGRLQVTLYPEDEGQPPTTVTVHLDPDSGAPVESPGSGAP